LVTSPLWAQELSFELLLEIASTHTHTHTEREQASFLPERVPGLCLPILAMSSQFDSLPFGIPLSSHNTALPGKYTHTLYNTLRRKEARILAQLRIGMTRLSGYLASDWSSGIRPMCLRATKKPLNTSSFRCTTWTTHRTQMERQADTRKCNLSFHHLGGKLRPTRNSGPRLMRQT
jgi:hypothetical protein